LLPIALFFPLDDLPSRLLHPSTFPLRTRYRLPIWDDLFNLVAAFLGRKDFTAPGGGGGGAAPFAGGMGGGGGDVTDPFIGGGGGGGTDPFIGRGGGGGTDPFIGGGGGGGAPLEGIMGSGGGAGAVAFIVPNATGGGGGTLVAVAFDESSGGGGGGGGTSAREGKGCDGCGSVAKVTVVSGVSFSVPLSLASSIVVVTSRLLFSSSIPVFGLSTFLFTLKMLESTPPTLDNA